MGCAGGSAALDSITCDDGAAASGPCSSSMPSKRSGATSPMLLLGDAMVSSRLLLVLRGSSVFLSSSFGSSCSGTALGDSPTPPSSPSVHGGSFVNAGRISCNHHHASPGPSNRNN